MDDNPSEAANRSSNQVRWADVDTTEDEIAVETNVGEFEFDTRGEDEIAVDEEVPTPVCSILEYEGYDVTTVGESR